MYAQQNKRQFQWHLNFKLKEPWTCRLIGGVLLHRRQDSRGQESVIKRAYWLTAERARMESSDAIPENPVHEQLKYLRIIALKVHLGTDHSTRF